MLSNFAKGRYGLEESIRQVWTYILSWMADNNDLEIKAWPSYLSPMYGKDEILPKDARVTGIRRGTEWFYNGKFFVHPSWKDFWLRYEIQGDGTAPFGPGIDDSMPTGDGTLGILEGHASTINYDGTQQYRYWMRADVQGEASMALAAAGNLFKNEDYKEKAENLVDYIFKNSNLRGGAKEDKGIDVYGMIGWATTFPGSFYGDDNARAILGSIAASAYLDTKKWDQELAEAIMGNFRRTSRQGFSGDRNEERDILKNGWEHYWTGDKFYSEAEDKLAKFLCRIQIQSEEHPELDGGWFRAFDFNRWKYWASNGDAGWGAWSIESGWSQSWITSVLALRQMKTSLWDITIDSKVGKHFDIVQKEMLPKNILSKK